MSEDIGKLIKNYRKSKKLTLEVLASKVGTSSGYLSEIETGKKKPGSELLLSLQRELEFPLGFVQASSQVNEQHAIYEKSECPTGKSVEEKLQEIGFGKIYARIISEFSKLSEEEQKSKLLELLNENIEKGRY